jgi:uncharacterized phage-associated protein
MPTAQQVADYFVSQLGLPETEDDRRKIHYLLYYANGYTLAMRGEPLFDDEIIAAEHGPEVPSVSFDLSPLDPDCVVDEFEITERG